MDKIIHDKEVGEYYIVPGESINILGIDYKIIECDVIDKFSAKEGEIDYLAQEIRLDSTLHDDRRSVVLLHEILHGIVDALSIECLEENEGAIQCLAIALYNTLKNNRITFS